MIHWTIGCITEYVFLHRVLRSYPLLSLRSYNINKLAEQAVEEILKIGTCLRCLDSKI